MKKQKKPSRLQPDFATMKEFLTQHTAGIPKGAGVRLELAWDDDNGSLSKAQLFEHHDIDGFIAKAAELNREKKNVYIGAACRAPNAAENERASDEDVVLATAVWADFDNKLALDRAIRKLKAWGIDPSTVVITGSQPFRRGHIWLFLTAPTEKVEEVVALNRVLAKTLGGDSSVANAGRVMRLGGSVAWPRKEGRVPELTRFWAAKSSAKTFLLKTLKARLKEPEKIDISPAATEEETSRNSAWAAAALEDAVRRVGAAKEGERNNTLNNEAVALGQLVGAKHLDRSEVERRLVAAGVGRGLGNDEAVATVKSGLKKGIANPRGPKPRHASELPTGFEMRPDGIYRTKAGGEPTFLCSPIRVPVRTRNSNGEAWGWLVELEDPDGRTHRLIIPAMMFATEGGEVRKRLLSRGLRIGATREAHYGLLDLLQKLEPKARVTTVTRLGWANPECTAFVWGAQVIGDPAYVLDPESQVLFAEEFRASGTLKQWRKKVAAYCVGNPMMVTAVSAAFASPLLEVLEFEGGGLHYFGDSTRGKTTLLLLGVSVWAAPELLQNWNATLNALEGLAAASNATILALDEINQGDPGFVADAAYALANGQSKARSYRTGEARPRMRWKVILQSTGESTLADAVAEGVGGKRIRAGQDVRILNIPADTRADGVFDALHGYANARRFSTAIAGFAARYHGVAGPAFVRQIMKKRLSAKKAARAVMQTFQADAFAKLNFPVDAQVRRAAARLAVIAAAGELATQFGVTGWKPGTATRAAHVTFKLWIKARRGYGSAEAQAAVDRTRRYVSQNGQSSFEPLHGPAMSIRDHAGWRDDQWFYITPDAWQKIHTGANAQQAARHLANQGLLRRETHGKHLTLRIKNKGRCYWVAKKILNTAARARI
jgi:putative DNA primase/helicase